jgi:hypothetical protein
MKAHVVQGSTEEFLRSLSGNVGDVQKYVSAGSLLQLAEKNPDHAAEFEGLASECATTRNDIAVIGNLYSYYILSGQFDKVKQLLEKFSLQKHRIRQAYACRLAKANKQEDVLN